MPGLRFVDAASGVLGIEWIDGKSVRFLLGSGDEGEQVDQLDEEYDVPANCPIDGNILTEYDLSKGAISRSYRQLFSHDKRSDALMALVGTEIATMHLADIIHGDLTTSNMMLRRPASMRNYSGIQQLVRGHFSRYMMICV